MTENVSSTHPSRRALFGGAVALGGGLAVTTATGTAQAAPVSVTSRSPFPEQPRTFVTRRGGDFLLNGDP